MMCTSGITYFCFAAKGKTLNGIWNPVSAALRGNRKVVRLFVYMVIRLPDGSHVNSFQPNQNLTEAGVWQIAVNAVPFVRVCLRILLNLPAAGRLIINRLCLP
ncbi:MAG: hypothetical protein AAFO94_14900, partial [Bacteroidota bacterium]